MVNLYDEKRLERLIRFQSDRAWDLEKSLPWDLTIDLNKPLVPLDENALFFPGAGKEERLVISQMMGLIIAACICEMEECLLRLRKQCWTDIHHRHPVSPEFIELGELFFEEEKKHSSAFRRYIEKFAETMGIELKTLMDVLPIVQGSLSEKILERNIKAGGMSFWWLVATVEQEFLSMHYAMEPHHEVLEPLYYDIHLKHFEEEARHASFPYLMLELLNDRTSLGLRDRLHKKGDLLFAQLLLAGWSAHALQKTKLVRDLRGTHPFFDALAAAFPHIEKLPPGRVLWEFFTRAPYVSSLTNPNSHKKIQRFAETTGSLALPFPQLSTNKLVRW